MPNILAVIATGAVASLVASGMFLAFLRAIRPRIVICDHITRSGGVYSLKIINRSRFELIDIDLRLDLVHSEPAPPDAGPLMTLKNVPLKTERLFVLSKYSGRDTEGRYAVRFAISGDLDTLWAADPEGFLLFRVAATHSLSGFRKVVSKRFTHDAIKDGNFHFGTSCEIAARSVPGSPI